MFLNLLRTFFNDNKITYKCLTKENSLPKKIFNNKIIINYLNIYLIRIHMSNY